MRTEDEAFLYGHPSAFELESVAKDWADKSLRRRIRLHLCDCSECAAVLNQMEQAASLPFEGLHLLTGD